MELNNDEQDGAASSNPAADLQARLRPLRVDDPSSSQQQPRRPAATSSRSLNPQQVPAPPPPHMFQFPQQVIAPPTPHMFQGPWQVLPATPDTRLLPHPHQFRDASTGWYFSPAGAYFPSTSSIYASPFGMNPPSFNAPNAPPPMLWNGSGSLDPYTRALPRARRADADPPPLTRAEVRACLLRGSTEQALVMSSVCSAHVIGLLAEGHARVRRRVIACVKPIVHIVMSNRYHLFLTLLHACNGRVDELKDIIGAMCNGKGFLMRFDDQDHNVDRGKALKEVIRVVAGNGSLCKTLIIGLLENERLMEEPQGPAVLRYCFATLPYEHCSMIFEYTIGAIDKMLSSRFGRTCVAVCFENARNGELEALEATILARTSAFAKDRWRSCFLQDVLEDVLWYGREQFKARIVERVAEDIVQLSVDQFGRYVVEKCFLPTGYPAGLQRVLDAFMDLRDEDLALVVQVQGWKSKYTVQKLLATGKDHLPMRTAELARRIEALPEVVLKHCNAKLVLETINELFPAQPIQ